MTDCKHNGEATHIPEFGDAADVWYCHDCGQYTEIAPAGETVITPERMGELVQAARQDAIAMVCKNVRQFVDALAGE